MKYTLALRTGGLMEDPEWHYDRILIVEVDSIREAKDKYADLTDLRPSEHWNPDAQTYWGWEIVGIKPLEEIKYEQ